MSTLLQRIAVDEAARREAERRRLLGVLRDELGALLPAREVWVFGSIVREGKFGDESDVDVALERRPENFSEYWLQGELELRLGRRVDVLILRETRLREKIEREGVRWTL